jgi:hypothetical protein
MKILRSFFTWYLDCQSLSLEDNKVEPQLLNKKKLTSMFNKHKVIDNKV